ncbi:hypothetical protein ACU5EH_25755 [Aliivibrio salmonicida]|uniref:hypothetical protein n=1 Tax=Aliivibrio salmonicida TaxID=40269 RepID=UPI00406CE7CE
MNLKCRHSKISFLSIFATHEKHGVISLEKLGSWNRTINKNNDSGFKCKEGSTMMDVHKEYKTK